MYSKIDEELSWAAVNPQLELQAILRAAELEGIEVASGLTMREATEILDRHGVDPAALVDHFRRHDVPSS